MNVIFARPPISLPFSVAYMHLFYFSLREYVRFTSSLFPSFDFSPSADRWSRNRSPLTLPFYSSSSRFNFRRVLCCHCFDRLPRWFESTSPFPVSRDFMYIHRNFSPFLFLSHCRIVSRCPFSALLSIYFPPTISLSIVDFLVPIGIRFTSNVLVVLSRAPLLVSRYFSSVAFARF